MSAASHEAEGVGAFDAEVEECPGCGGDVHAEMTCEECGWSEATRAAMRAQVPAPQPVVARTVDAQPLAVHEAAWCPYCVAWLGTFPSFEEARAYEHALTHHPVEFCLRRRAKLNGSEEWRLRHELKKQGSLAAEKPAGPRAMPEEASA